MKSFLKILSILLIIAGATFLSVFILINKIEFSLSPAEIVLLVVIIIAGLFIDTFFHMFFHEICHLIFGLLNGFKLHRITVGFFSVVKNNKKGYKFELVFSKYGGTSQMLPSSGGNFYRKFGLYVLGGLIGSLIAAAGFLLVLLLVNFTTLTGVFVSAALIAGFPVSVYFLCINAVPFSAYGISNDGGVIRGLIKKDSETQISINVLNIQSQLFAGLSPSQVPESFYFDVPVVADNNINKILLITLRYIYYLDKFDFEKSNATMAELARLEKYLPEIYLESILTDKFFNTVFYLKDINAGEEQYVKIKDFIESDVNICNLRIRMTYELFIKNNPRLAIATGKTALSLKEKYILTGVAIMEEKIINYLIETAEKLIAEQKS